VNLQLDRALLAVLHSQANNRTVLKVVQTILKIVKGMEAELKLVRVAQASNLAGNTTAWSPGHLKATAEAAARSYVRKIVFHSGDMKTGDHVDQLAAAIASACNVKAESVYDVSSIDTQGADAGSCWQGVDAVMWA
jgi:hypothetical protein